MFEHEVRIYQKHMFQFPKLYYISTTAIVASANNSMVLLMSKMGEKRKVIYLTVAAPLRCFNRNPIQETQLLSCSLFQWCING